MKRNSYRHPKVLRLAHRLGLESWGAVGIIEAFTQWAEEYALDGGLSRYRASDIAQGIGWNRDATELLTALVEERWIDNGGEQLIIHDWSQHAEDSVHLRLARGGKLFADGTIPTLRRLSLRERERLEPILLAAHAKRTACAQEAHDEHTRAREHAPPQPQPLPMPQPQPDPSSGGVEGSTSPDRRRKRRRQDGRRPGVPDPPPHGSKMHRMMFPALYRDEEKK